MSLVASALSAAWTLSRNGVSGFSLREYGLSTPITCLATGIWAIDSLILPRALASVTISLATVLTIFTRTSCASVAKRDPSINVMVKMAISNIIVPENPLRHVPRMPAIFCSCGVLAEVLVSFPIQAARFRTVPMMLTTSANMLKSRSCEISMGFRKLSPAGRSSITGAMSWNHDTFSSTKTVKITKIG